MSAVTIGEAIRMARASVTQEQLAERLGTDQARVSKWERNIHQPSLEEIQAIESALGRPNGYVLTLAGYVTIPTTSEAAIRMDPRLSDDARVVVLGALEASVRVSRPPAPPGRP